MKKLFIVLLSVLLFSCMSVNNIEEFKEENNEILEEPDYTINQYGYPVFKDWKTAFKYAIKSKDICEYLMAACVYNVEDCVRRYESGEYSKDEANYYMELWIKIYKELEQIYIIYHSEKTTL